MPRTPFFTVACARPPIVQFSSVGAKDTLRNVLATGEFVDGHPAMEQLQPVSRLGRNEWGLPPEVVALDRP